MELTELVCSDGLEEAIRAKQGAFLTKLSVEVDSLIINLDQHGCQALLEQMDLHTPQGETLVEMHALRTLRIVGTLKQWQQLEQPLLRLFHLLRPVILEELSLIGVDQMKVVRALLSHSALHGTLTELKLGLHGFHFLAQEDLVSMGAPLKKLRSLRLLGVDMRGTPCRENCCRMFICAAAFFDYLGQINNPDEFEVLHIANAGVLGDDQQIATLLRCLASFVNLRCLKLPLPLLPLTLREIVSLRLSLPRLLFFVAENKWIEGAETWPESEDWPPMTQIWPVRETITPLSIFSHEFLCILDDPAATEWIRLSENEQQYWIEAVPRIQQVYQRWEQDGCSANSFPDCVSDTAGSFSIGGNCASAWRAVPEARDLKFGERTSACQGDEAFDAQHACTHSIEDWRAEERTGLRGVLAMKASDICKEKARLRKELKASRPSEGVELHALDSSPIGDIAVQDVADPIEVARELFEDTPQHCCAREESGGELGGDTTATEL